MSRPLRDFEARGFRSLATLRYPVSDLDVFVGPNGVGKTNLYRALELLQAAAANTLARTIAQDGGLSSALWAGPRRAGTPARIHLAAGLGGASDRRSGGVALRYEVILGRPPPVSAAFDDEPQIKQESVTVIAGGGRRVRLLDRDGPSVMARDEAGRPKPIDIDLLPSETALGRLEDPSRYPELDAVRRTLLQWRFYHGFRTDAASPLRRSCAAAATPTLASDGRDLPAVFATLAHLRQDTAGLDAAVADAFPGGRLIVPKPDRTASFAMSFEDFPHRVFEAFELSDGTLRYLALAGALLAYRLPPFIALNEPESSLHPDLLAPLARMISGASRRSQVWLVTHSERLAAAVQAEGGGRVRRVVKVDGATQIEGLRPWGAFGEDAEDEA